MKSLQNLWSNNGRFTWSILPKRYIKSWVKKCLTKSWHMYLIKFWQIYLNKSWQQCYIKSWQIYLTAMLYQILAKSITFGQDWWVAQKARGEARTSLHVTWLKRKNVNRMFFSNSKQMRPNTSVQDICVILTDWLTYVMGIIFTDTSLLFREGRKKGPHNRILLA